MLLRRGVPANHYELTSSPFRLRSPDQSLPSRPMRRWVEIPIMLRLQLTLTNGLDIARSDARRTGPQDLLLADTNLDLSLSWCGGLRLPFARGFRGIVRLVTQMLLRVGGAPRSLTGCPFWSSGR